MTRHIFAIFFLWFHFQNANAQEMFWDSSMQPVEFHSFYFQDGVWRIDHFVQDEYGLLDLVGRQTFAQEETGKLAYTALKRSRSFQYVRSSYPLSSPRLAKGFLWEATQSWNWDWELKYAQWVRENANKQFFADHKIPADCADAALAFRWIFARINKLPAANHLANGQWMTHETFRKTWSKLPQHPDWKQDKRFLRALNDLLDSTYTHSLMQDSYPVAMNAESFREGIHHLALHGSSGHTQIVNEVNANSPTQIPLKLIWATVPRDLANLTEGGFWDGSLPIKKESGFFRILWPKKSGNNWVYESQHNIPHYSEEQYEEEFLGEETSFALALIKKISPNFDPILIYKNGLDLIRTSIKQRIQVVEDGFAFCSTADCSEGTANYENWSTPSRDKRLRDNLKELEVFLSSVQPLSSEPLQLWLEALKTETVQVLGQAFSLELFRTLWLAKAYSSQPWEPLDKRWPFHPKDFLHQLVKKHDDLSKQRQSKIANNPCAKSKCPKTSDNYKKFSTPEIDHMLRVLFLNALYYCKAVSLNTCQEFKDLMALESYDNEPLFKALFRSHFYSSDANASLTERWGQHMQNNSFEVFWGLEYYFENELGFLATQDSSGGTLYHREKLVASFTSSQKIVHLFKGGEVLLEDEINQSLWIYENGQVTDTGLLLNMPIEKLNATTFRVGTTLIRDSDSGPQIIADVTPIFPFFQKNNVLNNFLVFEKDSAFYAYYLEKDQKHLVLIGDHPSGETAFFVEGLAQSKQAILLRMTNSEKSISYYFRFLKNSKTIESLPNFSSINGRINDQVLLGEDPSYGESFVFQMDPFFNELSRKKLPGPTMQNTHNPSLFWVNGDKEAYLYRHLQGLSLESKTISKSKTQYINDFTHSHYLIYDYDLNTPFGSHSVFDYQSQSLQFKANYITEVDHPTSTEMFWALSSESGGEHSTYVTWKQDDQWVRFYPGAFSTHSQSHASLDPVDGEIDGVGVIGFEVFQNTPSYQSLSSTLFHLPGSVVVSLPYQ